MVLIKSGLNIEQVTLMRPISIENCISVLKQLSGLNSEGGLNLEWLYCGT